MNRKKEEIVKWIVIGLTFLMAAICGTGLGLARSIGMKGRQHHHHEYHCK